MSLIYALALSASLAAEPTVTHRDALPTRAAPSGQASVVELLRGDNAFVGELTLAAGARVPEHRDPTEEYLVVLEGAGTLTIDGQAHAVRAGSVIFMPADARVAFVNGDAPFRALQVFAGPGPAEKYRGWPVRGRATSTEPEKPR